MVGRARGRRSAALVIVALLAATAGLLATGGRAARADTPPPPQFNFTWSASSVVPGPGDSNIQDAPDSSVFATGAPGELCQSYRLFPPPDSPTSIGIYQGAVGLTGPLLLDLSDLLFSQCVEGVPQATIDALVADPGAYYIQLDTVDFPDGATRGQLSLQVPTINVVVASAVCPPDVTFPASAKTIAKECGAIALPGQGFPAQPGFTSTGFAGTYAYDDVVQGAGGFDEDLSSSFVAGGGTCDPQTHICNFGLAPYQFLVPVGVITVDPTVTPKGFKLADAAVTIDNETGVSITRGPNGHLSIDMTGRYQGDVNVTYYFTASPKLTPPVELAPTVDLLQAPVAADGGIALNLQYGAIEQGNAPISYALQVQTDGHTYKAVTTSTKPFATLREQAGHSYRFRVQATDQFGVASPWVVGPTIRLDTLQDTSPAIAYSGQNGGWTAAKSPGAYGGTTTSSSDGTALAQVTFTASEVALVMPLGPAAGTAFLQVDTSFQTLGLGAATYQPRQEVYTQAFGFVGTHTLQLQPSGNGRIDLDAIVILH